jgi:SP family myo-inositol transporter-like MFS transporter 13
VYHNVISLLPFSATCSSTHENSSWLFQSSCPNWLSFLPIIGICLYVFFFSPGMGPLPWTINSEIYPLWARAKCTGLATSVNWMSNLLISMTFLTVVDVLGESGAFFFYAVLAALGLAFFYLYLPETRGCSLEETETLFNAGSRTPDRAKEVPYARITGNVFGE